MGRDPRGNTKLVTAPTLEPVTLAELQLHLRLSSNDVAEDLTSRQSIAPGDHVVAPNYSLVGTGIDVLNKGTLATLVSGTNGTNGTVDAKIQESDDDATYTDWSGGAFTQVTEANDNATQEIEYSGIKQYIRVVASVAVATCDFGATVITSEPPSVEDDYLTNLIVMARRVIERISNRRLITQTWELALDWFPRSNSMQLPYPPLQTVTSVKYFDTDETEATFASSNYIVDTYQEPGQIVLQYSTSWPSTTLRTVNGVITRYVVGYGDAASDVPEEYKEAVKLMAAELYEHREITDPASFTRFNELPYSVQSLLWYDRVVPI